MYVANLSQESLLTIFLSIAVLGWEHPITTPPTFLRTLHCNHIKAAYVCMAVSSRFVEELSEAYGFRRVAWIAQVSPRPVPSSAVEAAVPGALEKSFGQTC